MSNGAKTPIVDHVRMKDEALRNLIALARPHFSDEPQMLALKEAEAALSPAPQPDAAQADDVVERMEAELMRLGPVGGFYHLSPEERHKISLLAANLLHQSPPADVAGMREKDTIERCAKVLDEAAQDWNRIRDPGMANNARCYARKIRALAGGKP